MLHAATVQHMPARDCDETQIYSNRSSAADGFSSLGAPAARPPLTLGYRVQVVPWRPDDDDQAGSPSKVNLASSSPNLSPSLQPIQAKADHISVPYLGTPRAVVSSYSYSPHPSTHSVAASHAPPPRFSPEPQQLKHLKQQQQQQQKEVFAPVTPPTRKHNEEADKQQHHHHHYHYLEPRLESTKAAQSPGGGYTSSTSRPSSRGAYAGSAAAPYETSSSPSSSGSRAKTSPEATNSPVLKPRASPEPQARPEPKASPEHTASPGPRYGRSQEVYRHAASSAVTAVSPGSPSAVPDLAALARDGLFTGRESNGSVISSISSSGSGASSGRCHLSQPHIEQLPDPQQPKQPLPDFLELFSGREYPGNPDAGNPLGISPPDSTPSSPSPSLVEARSSGRDVPAPPDMGKGYAAIHGRQGILTQLSEASDALNEAAAPIQRISSPSPAASLQRKLQERDEEISMLRGRLNELDPLLRERAGRAARQAQKELGDTNKRLSAKEAEAVVLNGVIAKLKDENAALMRRAEKAESAQKSIQAIERKARKEVEREAEARRAAQASLEQYKSVADGVQEDVKSLQGEACKLLGRKVARDKEVFNLKQKVAELQGLLAESLERAERMSPEGTKGKMQELRERSAFLQRQLQEADLRRQRDAKEREQKEAFLVHLLEAESKALREEAERLAREKGELQAELEAERRAREDEQAEREGAEEQRRLVEEEAQLMASMLCGPAAEEEYIQESMQWASLRAELESSLVLPPPPADMEEAESPSTVSPLSRSGSRGAGLADPGAQQQQQQHPDCNVSISFDNMQMLMPGLRAALADGSIGAARFEGDHALDEEDEDRANAQNNLLGEPDADADDLKDVSLQFLLDNGMFRNSAQQRSREEAPQRPPALVVPTPSGGTSPAVSDRGAVLRSVAGSSVASPSPKAGSSQPVWSAPPQVQKRPKSPFSVEADSSRLQPAGASSPWGADSDTSYRTVILHDEEFAEDTPMDSHLDSLLSDSLTKSVGLKLPVSRYSHDGEERVGPLSTATRLSPDAHMAAAPSDPPANATAAQRRAFLAASMPRTATKLTAQSPSLHDIHLDRLKQAESSSLPSSPSAISSGHQSGEQPTSPRGTLRRTNSMATLSARKHVLLEELTVRESRSGNNSPMAGSSPNSSLRRDSGDAGGMLHHRSKTFGGTGSLGGRHHHRKSSLSPHSTPRVMISPARSRDGD